MSKKTFGEIPLRTWNWLGVNEAKVDFAEETQVDEQIIEVTEGQTRRLNFINLRDETAIQKIHIRVANGGQVECTIVEAGNADSFSELVIDLDGDDSSADVAAVYFGDGDRKIDLNYIIHQGGRRTQAIMDVKGALSGNSDKVFRGTLDFLKGSKGSVGRESEEVIIISPNVRNRSVPLMLSHEDDVDGHHAVSIGRIDEDKLFYLMSRGFDQSEAEKLIVEAAFNPVLDRIDNVELCDEIRKAIQTKL